jgi:hypothetical protein
MDAEKTSRAVVMQGPVVNESDGLSGVRRLMGFMGIIRPLGLIALSERSP